MKSDWIGCTLWSVVWVRVDFTRFRVFVMRIFLIKFLVVLLAISTLFVASETLLGGWGRTSERIVATMSVIGLGCLLSIGCAIHVERGREIWFGQLGMALNALAAVHLAGNIWSGNSPDAREQLSGSVSVAAVLWSTCCIVWITRLGGYGKWIQSASTVCACFLAVGAMASLHDVSFSEFDRRLMGMIGVLFGAGILTVPLLALLRQGKPHSEVHGSAAVLRSLEGPQAGLELLGSNPIAYQEVRHAAILPNDGVDAWISRQGADFQAVRHPFGRDMTLVVVAGSSN